VNYKPVIPREVARRDAAMAIEDCIETAGADVALDFVNQLEAAYSFIGKNPAAGSPRWAHELDLPGLRCWRLKRFPWLVFYLERDDHVDVWRILHAKRDIPAWMQP